MKKTTVIVVIVLVVICGLGGMFMKNMAGMQAANKKVEADYVVSKGNLVVSVVDSGTIDAVNSVEVKSRVSGRLKELLVDEGDFVTAGQVIGVIDPLETQLMVEQNQAQLNGAESAAEKTAIDIQQRRVSSQADLEQAESRLKRLEMELKAQPTLTSSSIQEAQAEYNRTLRDRENLVRNDQPNARTAAVTEKKDAEVNFLNAQREFQRQSSLLGKGFVASRDVDTAKLQMDTAKLKLDAATDKLGRLDNEQRLELAKADEAVRSSEAALRRAKANSIQNGVKREEYYQAIADVGKARAALSDVASLQKSRQQNLATVAQLSSVLNDSKRQLRETQIRAPITGVVTKKELKVGELATGLSSFSAGTAIVRIEDRNSLRVKLNVNEIDVAKMKEGMEATITVDAFPNETFKGVVKRIAPTSNESTTGAASADAVVKYEVEIRLNSTDERLRSGMSAKCTLDVIRKNNVVVVNKDYVSKDGDKYFVSLAPSTPKGKPTPKEVKVGAESGAQYEVVSGLSGGEKLVHPEFKGPKRMGMMQAGPDDE